MTTIKNSLIILSIIVIINLLLIYASYVINDRRTEIYSVDQNNIVQTSCKTARTKYECFYYDITLISERKIEIHFSTTSEANKQILIKKHKQYSIKGSNILFKITDNNPELVNYFWMSVIGDGITAFIVLCTIIGVSCWLISVVSDDSIIIHTKDIITVKMAAVVVLMIVLSFLIFKPPNNCKKCHILDKKITDKNIILHIHQIRVEFKTFTYKKYTMKIKFQSEEGLNTEYSTNEYFYKKELTDKYSFLEINNYVKCKYDDGIFQSFECYDKRKIPIYIKIGHSWFMIWIIYKFFELFD